MACKAQRVLEQVKLNYNEQYYSELIDKIGTIGDKASIKMQAGYIKRIFDEVHGHFIIGEKVMRSCGYQCISNKTIKTAQALFRESGEDIERFLKSLNERRIGGGHLRLEGDSIIGVYQKCYCGIPKAVDDLPIEYCECSAGWFERLFSVVFAKDVRVNLIKTILGGSEECVFEISLS